MGMFDKMAKKVAEAAEAAAGAAADAQGPLPDAEPQPDTAVARSAACPACGSATLHESPEGRFSWDTGGSAGHGRAVFLGTSRIVTASPVSAVVCVSCGHLAHFVRDPARLAEVAAAWPPLR